MEQVEGLLEELPTEAEVCRELRRDLPVVLDIRCDVLLFEGNQRVALSQVEAANAREEIAVIGEREGAGRVGQERIGGVLIVEFSAECDAMTTKVPSSIVLSLTGLDDSPLREVVGKAEG